MVPLSAPNGSPGDIRGVITLRLPATAHDLQLTRNAQGRHPGLALIHGQVRMHAANHVVRREQTWECACAKPSVAAGWANARFFSFASFFIGRTRSGGARFCESRDALPRVQRSWGHMKVKFTAATAKPLGEIGKSLLSKSHRANFVGFFMRRGAWCGLPARVVPSSDHVDGVSKHGGAVEGSSLREPRPLAPRPAARREAEHRVRGHHLVALNPPRVAASCAVPPPTRPISHTGCMQHSWLGTIPFEC